jgi:SecDF, P1 head subdomain
MTDLRLDDAAFERALRVTLADLAPETTPETLRAAVAAVTLGPRRGVAARGRALFAVVGLAAAVVVALVGLAMVSGPDGLLGGPGPAGTPQSASPTPATESLTFRVVTPDGSTASKARVDHVSEVMAARLRAYGIGTFSSSASDDRITIELALPAGAGTRETIRGLLGTPGAFSIGQPVMTPLVPGDPVEGAPLLTRDGITDARVGTDQTGNPTLELTFSGPSAVALADASATHIGEYLPIALDGVAIAVPVITSEIPDGRVQIQFASDDKVTPAWLVAILQVEPLPLPVEAVTP